MHSKFKWLIRSTIDRTFFKNRPSPGMESVYQGIVQRDLARWKIEDRFYPLGGAANYGLFYIVLRAAAEFPLKNVIELGSGQTSLLLDALARANALLPGATICAVEHDVEWANKIASRVAHEVVTAELVPRNIDGIKFNGYNFDSLKMDSIDLLIVDGPPAFSPETKFSRLGALALVRHLNPSHFIVVVDDAEREGETLLGWKIMASLNDHGIRFTSTEVLASKRQLIIAGGDFAGAAYF